MRKYSMKSIILGMGLGMILSSICGIIYFNSLNISIGYDKETIIRKAEELGMIHPNEVSDKKNIIMQSGKTPSAKDVNGNTNNVATTSPTPVNVTPTPAVVTQTPVVATPTPAVVASAPLPKAEIPMPTLGPEIIVKVDFGDTAVVVAKKLFDSGLIKNEAAFVDQMIETKVAYNLMAKAHVFRMGMEPVEILNILVTR